MSRLFSNHSYISTILRHKKLPIIITTEFSFYRCVSAKEWVYNKTISELHAGNLRDNDNKGRYSRLFSDKKISYWADSKSTALSEIKKHGANKNYITFEAYDDLSSTFPTLDNQEDLRIADGRELNFKNILLKIENDEELTSKETEIIKLIESENPDCLAYESVAREGGVNFLFFEKGFRKLSLREVRLHLGERKSKNNQSIVCAVTSDYSPILESYGSYFEPLVKVKMNNNYKYSEEYKKRSSIKNKYMARFSK